MWAQAVRLFGLSPWESWCLDWDEFRALADVHQEAEKDADYRAGIVAAILRNANRSEGEGMFGPEDFFPSLADEDDDEMSSAETGEFFKTLVLAMGGKVIMREA